MMRHGTTLIGWLLAVTLTVLAPSSGAAAAGERDPETEPATSPEETPASESEQQTPAGAPPAAGEEGAAEDAGPGTEVFVPSEEISEDFAVSFPVDI